MAKAELENWTYEGPEYGMVQPRNARGENGRARVETTEGGERIIGIDGIRFQVPKPLAEELLAALATNLRPHTGLSLFERVMSELDTIIDRLMAGNGAAAEDGRDPGRAEAFTMCLAIMRNPYEPNYEGERDRAMERWGQNDSV